MSDSTIGNGGHSGNRQQHSHQDSDSHRGNVNKFQEAMRNKAKKDTYSDNQQGNSRANNNPGMQVASRSVHSGDRAPVAEIMAPFEQVKTDLLNELKKLNTQIDSASTIDTRIGSAKDFLEFAKQAVSDAEQLKNTADVRLQEILGVAAAANQSLPQLIEKNFQPTELQQAVLERLSQRDAAAEKLTSLTADMDKANSDFNGHLQGSNTARQDISTTHARLREILTQLNQFDGGDLVASILDSQHASLELSDAALAQFKSLHDNLAL